MTDVIVGLHSLNTVLQGVEFTNPALADTLRADIEIVSLYSATTIDKAPAQGAAGRLRQAALELAPVHARVLNDALDDLGFE